MLKTVRHHAKSQGLNPGLSLGGRSAVREYAGQLRYLGDPAPVSFAFELDSESHGSQPGFILRPTAAQSGEHRLSSIDRCNSPPKHLGWFHPIECLSRAVVQLSGDRVEMGSAVKAQVGVAREVLA
jgi:hypothetical protein